MPTFLLEFIVKSNKKDDPSQQSIWNSDTTRLTYAVKELMNEKDNWCLDKKGIKTTKSVIEPLLDFLKLNIKVSVKTKSENFHKVDSGDLESNLKDMKILNDISSSIDDKSLANNIIKLMAAHFYLNKNEDNVALLEGKN